MWQCAVPHAGTVFMRARACNGTRTHSSSTVIVAATAVDGTAAAPCMTGRREAAKTTTSAFVMVAVVGSFVVWASRRCVTIIDTTPTPTDRTTAGSGRGHNWG